MNRHAELCVNCDRQAMPLSDLCMACWQKLNFEEAKRDKNRVGGKAGHDAGIVEPGDRLHQN